MRQALTVSSLFHVLLIIAASVVWPRMITPPPVEQTMSVELVTIAAETRAPKAEKPTPKAEPEPEKPEPVPEQKAPVQLPPVPTDMPALERRELPKPEPMPKLAVRSQDLPKLDKLDFKKIPEPPKEVAKPKPAEKPLDLSKIAETLNKLDKKPDTAAKPQTPVPQTQSQIANAAEGSLTMSEKDALRALIGRNWNVPTGAPKPEDLVVVVRFTLNPDGTLSGPPQLVNAGAYTSNSFFRAAADAALRAVQMTQPYKLPANKYNEWRDIVLTFDPRDMIRNR